jgi:plastocyanin
MKNIFTLLIFILSIAFIKAENYSITTSGFSYSPDNLSVNVGDVITISASNTHPLVQVDKETWGSNGSTPSQNGWGVKTSDYSFTAETEDTIYYVCQNHVGMGMKGMIIVSNTTSVSNLSNMENDIEVYPNPVNDVMFVSAINDIYPFDLAIYSMSGSMLISKKINSKDVEINTSGLKEGFYLLDLNYGEFRKTRKIVVVR